MAENTDPTVDTGLDPSIAEGLAGPDIASTETDTSNVLPVGVEPAPYIPNEDPHTGLPVAPSVKAPLPKSGMVYNDVWNELKTRLSTDDNPYELPTEITEGKWGEGRTEFDALVATIAQNLRHPDPLEQIQDPFMQRYIAESQKEGFDRNEWLKNESGRVNLLDLPSKEYLFQKFKSEATANNLEWTDDDINNHISSMSPIQRDLEAKKLKDVDRAELEKTQTINTEAIRTQQLAKLKEMNDKRVEIAKTVIQAKADGDVFGLDVSKADRDEYNKAFPEMIKLDPQTGTHKISQMLQSDNELLY